MFIYGVWPLFSVLKKNVDEEIDLYLLDMVRLYGCKPHRNVPLL